MSFFHAPAHGLLAIDINTGVVEITPMKGHTAADVEKALEDGWQEVADAQSVAVGQCTGADRHSPCAARSSSSSLTSTRVGIAQAWQPALSVKTADGFIVDVTNTTDGRVALIAAPDAAGKPDFTKPLTQVLARCAFFFCFRRRRRWPQLSGRQLVDVLDNIAHVATVQVRLLLLP